MDRIQLKNQDASQHALKKYIRYRICSNLFHKLVISLNKSETIIYYEYSRYLS